MADPRNHRGPQDVCCTSVFRHTFADVQRARKNKCARKCVSRKSRNVCSSTDRTKLLKFNDLNTTYRRKPCLSVVVCLVLDCELHYFVAGVPYLRGTGFYSLAVTMPDCFCLMISTQLHVSRNETSRDKCVKTKSSGLKFTGAPSRFLDCFLNACVLSCGAQVRSNKP